MAVGERSSGKAGGVLGLGSRSGSGDMRQGAQNCISEIFQLWAGALETSGPITLWEIDGETVETMSDFIFGGSKITADGDCSHDLGKRYPV